MYKQRITRAISVSILVLLSIAMIVLKPTIAQSKVNVTEFRTSVFSNISIEVIDLQDQLPKPDLVYKEKLYVYFGLAVKRLTIDHKIIKYIDDALISITDIALQEPSIKFIVKDSRALKPLNELYRFLIRNGISIERTHDKIYIASPNGSMITRTVTFNEFYVGYEGIYVFICRDSFDDLQRLLKYHRGELHGILKRIRMYIPGIKRLVFFITLHRSGVDPWKVVMDIYEYSKKIYDKTGQWILSAGTGLVPRLPHIVIYRKNLEKAGIPLKKVLDDLVRLANGTLIAVEIWDFEPKLQYELVLRAHSGTSSTNARGMSIPLRALSISVSNSKAMSSTKSMSMATRSASLYRAGYEVEAIDKDIALALGIVTLVMLSVIMVFVLRYRV